MRNDAKQDHGMISPSDLGGLMAMMPAFATDDAQDIGATATVSVERLEKGLDRMIRDGADVVATTGSFGEFHTLLHEELEVLAGAAAEVNAKRVPLFIGTTGLNSREVVRKMRVVEKTSADGVLLGVPFYFPSSPANVLQFYRSVAELFPKLGIMIYHNPALHNVTLTLPIMAELAKIPNVVAMKDSHRQTGEFLRMMEETRGKIRVFVNQLQYSAYAPLGAAGFWSIDAWMGPWPQLALRDAIASRDFTTANRITVDLTPAGDRPKNLAWRETAAKVAVRYAGYVDPGPLRPPFVQVPPEVEEAQRKRAERWLKLCAKYRHPVPA
jgi:dihydrodipicolinate synthase/N-acetylneuraminate lyase